MLKFLEKELQKKHYENEKLKKDIALKKEQFIDLKRWYEKSIENLSTSFQDEKKNKHCLFTKVEIHVGEGYTQTQIALRPDNNIAQTLTLLATYTKDQHEAKFENSEPDFSEDNYRVLPLFQKFIIEDLCDQLGYKLHIEEGDV